MDSMTTLSSNQHLKPPPPNTHHRQRDRTSTTSSASTTPTSTTSSAHSRPPLHISKTATVADSAVLHGTHPISIGTGTVIHPRARLYSYEAPINIGDGCIISEKCVIGGSSVPLPTPSMLTSTPASTDDTSNPSSPSSSSTTTTTYISNAVTIAPLATILPGSYVHSTAVIESLAVVGRNASIGSHSKVCAGCEIPDEVVIGEWTVVWGSGSGFGQRRRKRTVGKVGSLQTQTPAPEARVVEDARMMVMQKEREALVRMLAVSAGGASKRR